MRWWPDLRWPAMATLFLVAVIPVDLFPWLRGPAPYPPEWQWYLRTTPVSGTWLPAVAVVAAFLAAIALTRAVSDGRAERRAARLLLGAAMLLGFAFQLALVTLEPDGAWRTFMARAASRTITSYHVVAISEDARDPGAFLAAHDSLLEGYRTTAKHAATHPPGPVLYYRAALAACTASPALTEALLGAARVPDRDFPPPNTRAARAAALLGALGLGLAGAAAIWPLAGLARTLGLPPLPAARVAALFVLLPGPALMTPQFDQALALPVTAATAILARAMGQDRPWPRAVLAGLFAAGAVFTSYGSAAFLAIGGLAAWSLAKDQPGARRGLGILALAAATALALTASTALLGHDPWASAGKALAIHREAYTSLRSYWLWLAFNPLDLAIFLGAPVTAIGLRQAWHAFSAPRTPLSPARRFGLAVGSGLGLLLLSGLTRGEVGRLWIPLMPMLLVSALAAPAERGSGDSSPTAGTTVALAGMLAALCATIAVHWTL